MGESGVEWLEDRSVDHMPVHNGIRRASDLANPIRKRPAHRMLFEAKHFSRRLFLRPSRYASMARRPPRLSGPLQRDKPRFSIYFFSLSPRVDSSRSFSRRRTKTKGKSGVTVFRPVCPRISGSHNAENGTAGRGT